MTPTRVAVFTEQRGWFDPLSGVVRGRKELSAIHDLGDKFSCNVAYRASVNGDGHDVLLPGSCSGTELLPEGSHSPVHQTLQSLRSVRRADVSVVYQPGIVGAVGGLVTLALRKPLVVVAVGDPAESLSAGVLHGVRGRVIRNAMVGAMKLLCRRAVAVRYVTKYSLQARYPASSGASVFSASDVGVIESTVDHVRNNPDGAIHLLTVASLDQPYKGVQELIDACELLRQRGYGVRLSVAGTGRLMDSLRAHADDRAPGAVEFLGHLTGDALRSAYADCDIFVLASWTEGLPRVILEAMAAARPVVATSVGGVPELVDEQWLVPPRDSEALAAVLETAVRDQTTWTSWGRANRAAAVSFAQASLAEHRRFISHLKGSLAHE